MKIHHGGGSAGHPAEKPRQQLQQGDPEVQRYCRGVLEHFPIILVHILQR